MKVGMAASGMDDLQKLFKDLPKRLTDDVIAKVLTRASTPVATEMKKEVRNTTGSARMQMSVGKKTSKRMGAVFVKVRGVKAKQMGLPTNIGHLWTFGHGGIRGNYRGGARDKKWKDRSWDRAESRVYAIIDKQFDAILFKEIERYKQRSAKTSRVKARRLVKQILMA